MKFCCVAPTSAQTVPDKLSRQTVAIAAMCCLARKLPAVSVAPDLIRGEVSARCLTDAREAKDVFPGLALVLVRPFLSQMIIILLDHREAGIVKVVGRFQACNSDKRKFNDFRTSVIAGVSIWGWFLAEQ